MASMTAIQNARIVCERQIIPGGTLLIADGNIAALGKADDVAVPPEAQRLDARNAFIGPGFVDIHNHCGGWRFVKAEVAKYAEYYLRHGTTSLLPTFYYQMSFQQVLDGLDSIDGLMKEPGSTVRGVNFEGPYLNAHYGYCGEMVWDIRQEEYEAMIEKGDGIIKIWSVAPEREGILAFVKAASAIRPVFAVAHSEATAEELYALLPYGLKLATHHLNATGCRGGHWADGVRNFGLDEAVQLCDEISIELIADSMGVHVSPQWLQLAYKIKGPGRTILITDSTEFMDSEDITKRGDLRYGAKGDLAGSAMTMDGALRNMIHHAGVSLCDAFRMASTSPARLIGLQDRGVMAEGYAADLVFLDDDLQVQSVMVDGQQRWQA